MDSREWQWAILGGILFVFLSSLLGLCARIPPAAMGIMSAVWGASVIADLVFVAGTLAVGQYCFVQARDNWKLSVVAGFLGHWMVYWVSFLLLPESLSEDVRDLEGIGGALVFVVEWGFAGLIFAALAPLGARWLWDRKISRPAR